MSTYVAPTLWTVGGELLLKPALLTPVSEYSYFMCVLFPDELPSDHDRETVKTIDHSTVCKHKLFLEFQKVVKTSNLYKKSGNNTASLQTLGKVFSILFVLILKL